MFDRNKTKTIITHQCSKETEIALIKNNQDYQTKMLEEMHHRLLGNGKPGIIADIQELQTMKSDYKETKNKVEDMNKKMWQFAGAVAVITFILGILVPKIVSAVLG